MASASGGKGPPFDFSIALSLIKKGKTLCDDTCKEFVMEMKKCISTVNRKFREQGIIQPDIRDISVDKYNSIHLSFQIFTEEDLESVRENGQTGKVARGLLDIVNETGLGYRLGIIKSSELDLRVLFPTEPYERIKNVFSEEKSKHATSDFTTDHGGRETFGKSPDNSSRLGVSKTTQQQLPHSQRKKQLHDPIAHKKAAVCIPKTFKTYISNPKNDEITVKIKFHNSKLLGPEILTFSKTSGLYCVTVHIPKSEILRTRYVYEVTQPYLKVWSSSNKSEEFTVRAEDTVQRDLWTDDKIEDVRLHLQDIVSLKHDMKGCVIEIERFCRSLRYDINQSICSAVLKQVCESNTDSQTIALLPVIIGNLMKIHDKRIVHEIPQRSALNMLTSIAETTDFPASCLNYLFNACFALCEIATQATCSWLTVMAYTYPLFNETHFANFIANKAPSLTNSGSDTEKIVEPLLEKMLYRATKCTGETSPEALIIALDGMIYHCTLPLASCVFVCLHGPKREGIVNREQLQVMLNTITDRVTTDLKHPKCNFNYSLILLKKLSTVLSTSPILQAAFENAIIEKASKITDVVEINADEIIYKIFSVDGIFSNSKQRLKFLNALADSKTQKNHMAFLKIMKHCDVKTSAQDETRLCGIWFRRLLDTHAEGDLIYLYRSYFDLMDIEQLNKNTKIREKLTFMLTDYLQKQDMLKLLRQLKHLEKQVSESEHSICSQHVKDLILKTRIKPCQIIQACLHGNLCSRLELTAVYTVVERYCSFEKWTNKVDKFISMTKKVEIWRLVLKLTGIHRKDLLENATIREGEEIVEHVCKCLVGQKLEYEYFSFENIEKEIFELISMSTVSKTEDLGKIWLNSKAVFFKENEKLNALKSVIDTLSEKCIHNLPEWFNCFKTCITDISHKFKTVTLSDLTSEWKEWQQLDQLLACCMETVPIISSYVYWLLYDDNLLSETFPKCVKESQEKDDIDHIKEYIMLVYNLIKAGNEKYNCAWSDLEKNESLDIQKVFSIFGDSLENVGNEIKFASTYMKRPIDTNCEKTLKRVSKLRDTRIRVEALEAAIRAFGLNVNDDIEFTNAVKSFHLLLQRDNSTILTISQVDSSLAIVHKITDMLDECTITVIDSIGKASSLVDFLRDIEEDDLRNLIDAVEDISEQYVSESVVSALIELQSFFRTPFKLKRDTKMDCKAFIKCIQEQLATLKDNKKLPSKIIECGENLHNLKSLYKNLANRGEQTKEIIKSILTHGNMQFKFCKETKVSDFYAFYLHANSGGKAEHSKATLIDCRSRALLMINSEQDKHYKTELGAFVEIVDLSIDIAESISILHLSGHKDFKSFEQTKSRTDLKELQRHLETVVHCWKESLENVKQRFYLMSFIQGIDMHVLNEFFHSDDGESDDVDIILKYIHPQLQSDTLKRHYFSCKEKEDRLDEQTYLEMIGNTLHLSCKDIKKYERPVKLKDGYELRMTDVVQNRKLLVVRLEEGTGLVLNTILALFRNTLKVLPEPYQVLFCTTNTSWDAVELLLCRCFGAYRFFTTDTLFCIANVELLSNDVQYNLAKYLKSSEGLENFLLAIVFQGPVKHPFINEFKDFVMPVRPLSDAAVQNIYCDVCPFVYTYTSDIAGLGKTNTIMSSAHRYNKTSKTLCINGPVMKRKIIDELKDLHVKEKHLLHVDIGYIDNPAGVDELLFELIILQHASAEGVAVSLSTSHVAIEIANSINDTIRNSLRMVVLFQRKHLKWNSFKDFCVCQELQSPVQVVCHYLLSLLSGNADKDDIHFSGEQAVKPLSSKHCKILLKKFFKFNEMSFSNLNIFLNVLADQLKKMSCSIFFRTSRIRDMVGGKTTPKIKSSLFRAMIDTSQEFASRSVKDYRSTQELTLKSKTHDTATKSDLAGLATKHTENMIRWDDSNHLIYAFHNQNIQTISCLYREKSKVPLDVKQLFESQMKREIIDFSKASQDMLQVLLERVVRTNPSELTTVKRQTLQKDYALTPDNLLKMILIMLRINAGIPVIVMGETGCGKTALIRYLAAVCEVPFEVINIHAGVQESELIRRLQRFSARATTELQQEHWIFLDEINTSEHIGLLSDAVCHNKCAGKVLAPNLVVMAACNPYKLRSEKAVLTSGLQGKVKTDELSRLVYRVLPLPEMLVDYVWDFGSLSETDEKLYISQMVSELFVGKDNLKNLFVDLLSVSQTFTRTVEDTTNSVSLRDIQRNKILTSWFLNYKKNTSHSEDNEILAIILALSHCYQSRFSRNKTRREYIHRLVDIFARYGFSKYTENTIRDVIKQEQAKILSSMELPVGTAQNTALQENVFVILVCILNRIPIFVVGKPGCSKSLSMQIIRSNLRGKDSRDPFLRTQPQLYCVSFQGSESSTSDGIIKVFEKAENYQRANSAGDVLSVVILDEIGLAELSKFNPLKVLHSLLEPDGLSRPNVAVVGISNWSLDASKMNRAIHLSRPEMDQDELFETAKSISDSFQTEEKIQLLQQMQESKYSFKTSDIEKQLNDLASAYTRYITALRYENFHGLRDYYSLVKYVAMCLSSSKRKPNPEEISAIITKGVERNFGGLPEERDILCREFAISTTTSTLELLRENVTDQIARHLMLITTGESVLGIIEKELISAGRLDIEILFGSQFEEDLNDDYNYRMLSRIILCMEHGLVLILKDLDSIYGSLYDMLNKNYTQIRQQKHCRVALGPYSNPICHVNDAFKCIVLVDEDKVDYSDPPFLNRFEKQYLRFSDILNDQQKRLIEEIETWIGHLCSIVDKAFSEIDCFPVYSKHLVPSLILALSERCSDIDSSSIEIYIRELLWMIKPEAIIRTVRSTNESFREASTHLQEEYFKLPLHCGLSSLIEFQLSSMKSENPLTIVFTNSTIHSSNMNKITNHSNQVEQLSSFKSEKELNTKLQHFWLESDCEVLFLQCSITDDEKHIMLAKLVIERNFKEFKAANKTISKRAYFIIHLDKSKQQLNSLPQINFLSGWKLVMLDSIQCPEIAIPELCKLSLYDAVLTHRPFK